MALNVWKTLTMNSAVDLGLFEGLCSFLGRSTIQY